MGGGGQFNNNAFTFQLVLVFTGFDSVPSQVADREAIPMLGFVS